MNIEEIKGKYEKIVNELYDVEEDDIYEETFSGAPYGEKIHYGKEKWITNFRTKTTKGYTIHEIGVGSNKEYVQLTFYFKGDEDDGELEKVTIHIEEDEEEIERYEIEETEARKLLRKLDDFLNIE